MPKKPSTYIVNTCFISHLHMLSGGHQVEQNDYQFIGIGGVVETVECYKN